MAYGMSGFIGLAKETTWGTAVAASDYFDAMSENLSLAIDRFDITNIINRFAEPDDVAGVQRISGDISFAADPISIGYFLRSVTGTMSGSVVLSGFLFQNDFTFTTTDFAADCPVPPYTFEVFRDVTSSHQYAGGVVNRLALAIQPNQDLRATAGILAKSASVITKTAASFPGSPVIPFAFDTASIQIGGAATALIEGMTVTLDNQLDGIPLLNNSAVIGKIRRRGFQMARVSGTLAFENVTEYQNFINQTEQVLKLNLFRANSFGLLVDIPRFVYTTFPVSMPGRERLTIGFDGIARYHAGSAQAIKIGLTTTKSNY